MTWKIVNNGDAGDAAHYGGNDIDKVGNLFNGVANVDTVTINSSTTFQNGKLTIQGHAVNRVAKTANYGALASDEIIECNANGGSFTITLPTAVGITGQIYMVKREDSSTGGLTNIVTIATTSSQTIDGAYQWVLTNRSDFVMVYSDGANWQVLDYSQPQASSGLLKGSTLNYLYGSPVSVNTAPTTATVVAGTIYATPFIVSKTTTYDIIQIDVTTLGSGSSARMAIYYDGGNGYPGALVTGSDVGTVATSTTGVKSNTFASPIILQPGMYWLAFNCSATAPIVAGYAAAQMLPVMGQISTMASAFPLGWSVSLAFAAFPTTFTGGGAVISAVPLPMVLVRAIA